VLPERRHCAPRLRTPDAFHDQIVHGDLGCSHDFSAVVVDGRPIVHRPDGSCLPSVEAGRKEDLKKGHASAPKAEYALGLALRPGFRLKARSPSIESTGFGRRHEPRQTEFVLQGQIRCVCRPAIPLATARTISGPWIAQRRCRASDGLGGLVSDSLAE
jgi:hypothetical protein